MTHPRLRFASASLLTAVAGFLAAASGASAAASPCLRYAAPTGSDAAAGTAAAPYRSAQQLAVSLEPGETGCLRAGTYSQEIEGPYVIRFNHGGAPGHPITVRSAPGERATLRGIVFVPNGSDDVTLSNLTIDGRRPVPAEAPVSIQVMAKDTILEDLDVTNHNLRSCVLLGSESGWGRARNTIVRRNVFHDCGNPDNAMRDHAIYSDFVDNAEIVDNLFLRTAAFAVHLYPDTQDSRVAHNVMVDNGGGVIFAGDYGFASSGNVVEHNVISGSKQRPGLQSWWGSGRGTGNVARSNCTLNPAKGEFDNEDGGYSMVANVTADPTFRDAAHGDYRLGSAACLAAVGYDTAAKLRADATVPPATVPAPGADPVASPAPAEPISTPAESSSQEQEQGGVGSSFMKKGRKARRARAKKARASSARGRSVRARVARR